MQSVSLGDSLHEMSHPILHIKRKFAMECRILFSGKIRKILQNGICEIFT